jgi:hypothetical protein
VDRPIAPSAYRLASSGTGAARLQFSCSPCLADLRTASAEAAGTDVAMYGSRVTNNFHRLHFMSFPLILYYPHGEVRIALRNGIQWKSTHKTVADGSVLS